MTIGTKEDCAKTIREVAHAMMDIADKIEVGNYNPDDWKEVYAKFSTAFACLKVQGHEFVKSE